MKNPSANGKTAVIYARVSSQEQREEGYSIDAQLRLLRNYATEKGLRVVEEYCDAETAKESGRTNFGLMLKFLERQPSENRVILVEKTDRLYRNFHDYVKVDDLDAVIHLVKEGEILSKDSRSSAKFIHGIKVLMAKNYIDNLSEEVKKGLTEKAEQGSFPGRAPLGYKNVVVDGKHTIVVDEERAPLVIELFERYALGNLTLVALVRTAREKGLRSTFGNALKKSSIYSMLRNPFYLGRFCWKGTEYRGEQSPLISNELFGNVQAALKKDHKPPFETKREFAFTGLLKCAHCGSSITAEMKKGKYIYYHCTGFKGKCDKPYIREEDLDNLLRGLVDSMGVDSQLTRAVQQAMRLGHEREERVSTAQKMELAKRKEALVQRMDKMYEDKLDGSIPEQLWRRKSEDIRAEINEIERRLIDLDRDRAPYYQSVDLIIELVEAAPALYKRAMGREKAKLLKIALSNCTFDGENLHPDWRKPFSLLVGKRPRLFKLPPLDSNQQPYG